MQYIKNKHEFLQVRIPSDSRLNIVNGPINYSDDVLHTNIIPHFSNDPLLQDAFSCWRRVDNSLIGENFLDWKYAISCQLAAQALRIVGDFVELGVFLGKTAYLINEFCALTEINRRLWLYDSWEAWNDDQANSAERAIGLHNHFRNVYNSVAMEEAERIVRKLFSSKPNVNIVKGPLPQTLATNSLPDHIAFCSIDLNSWEVERHVLNEVWNRMSPGGILLHDDYGYPLHLNQATGIKEFAINRQIVPITLPTGQAVLLKP